MSFLTAALLFLLSGTAAPAAPCQDVPATIEVAHSDHVDWPMVGERVESQERQEKHFEARWARVEESSLDLEARATRVCTPYRDAAGKAQRAVRGCVDARGPPAQG